MHACVRAGGVGRMHSTTALRLHFFVFSFGSVRNMKLALSAFERTWYCRLTNTFRRRNFFANFKFYTGTAVAFVIFHHASNSSFKLLYVKMKFRRKE